MRWWRAVKEWFDWPETEPLMLDTDAFSDMEILAKTLWGEARNQGEQGMQAVANVIMNRVSKPGWWGKDVRSVCLKSYQFSCWLKSDPNRAKMLAVTPLDEQYRIAEVLAEHALSGALPDITHGATSYYAKSMSVPPMWANGHTPVAEIGEHRFYNV